MICIKLCLYIIFVLKLPYDFDLPVYMFCIAIIIDVNSEQLRITIWIIANGACCLLPIVGAILLYPLMWLSPCNPSEFLSISRWNMLV